MPKGKKGSMISGFDSKLVALIESHPSIIVGTCDRALVPCVGRAFGARVLQGGPKVDLLVSGWPGPQTIANVEATGRMAVTFTSPETFESYQAKGPATILGECDAADIELSTVYTETIRARLVALKEPGDVVRVTFTPRGLYKLRLDIEAVFLQTPGKNAGAKL
jgi:hypothetical protein